MCAIEVESLSKRYTGRGGPAFALSDLSLSVAAGETVALIGENGAGKSTLIRILATLLDADSGRASIGGFDLGEQSSRVRGVIGVALQDVSLYPAGRVRNVLQLHARLHGFGRMDASRRSDEIVELVGLQRVSGQKVHRLSGGMRRRLDLGLAMIHRPPVLLLDEPTASLDPTTREELWDELIRLGDEGVCVLLATQDMEEVERLADRAVVLVDGTIRQDDVPALALRDAQSGAHAW